MRAVNLLVLALCALVGAATAVQAQSNPNLCVSGSSNASDPCDVISGGVLLNGWDDPSQHVLSNAVQPEFWIYLTDAADTLPITLTYNGLGDAGEWVALWTDAVNTPLNYTLTTDAPVEVTGELVCSMEGVTNYTVTIGLGDAYAPITLIFGKQCLKPIFDVATNEHGTNVVAANKPQKSFESFTVTEATDHLDFWVYLSDSNDPTTIEQPFTLQLTSKLPDVLQVTPTGDDGWNGVAMADPFGWKVSASFQCVGNPNPAIVVPVWVELQNYGWSEHILIVFQYTCGQSLSVPGLSVGTQPGLSDVAIDGVAIAPWNRSMMWAPDASYNFVLSMQSNTVTDTIPFVLNAFPENEDVLSLAISSPTQGGFEQGVSMDFTSEITCLKKGATRILWQLTMGQYAPVTVYLYYTCDPPLINLGSAAGVNDMMARSVVNPQWPMTGAHILGNQIYAPMYVVLDFGNTNVENDFSIDWNTADGSTNIMQPSLADPLNGQATKDEDRAEANPIILSFNCNPCITTAVHSSPVVLKFSYGWSTTATFTFEKDCLPDPVACSGGGGDSGSGHHGMTKAGVAALVIFLLSFAACVGGCAYNKLSLHKRGWAIVPGATAAAHCFDQISTGGRSAKWTPQENDDGGASYHAGGSHSAANETGSISAGGGGYQSYSSNL